ncbi:MAG: hypothetical protein Q8898_06170 [Bacillota bacterium]|nr:hypothetical protein [Bacillota bacterium]
MNTFLLIISLLLNGLAIYAIIVLYTRQNRLMEVEKNQGKMIEEMEELISSYLFEMKEENEVFLKKFELLSGESSKLETADKNSKNRTIKVLHKTGQQKGKESTEEKVHEADSKFPERVMHHASKAYQSNQKLTEINIIESKEDVDTLWAELDYSREMEEFPTDKLAKTTNTDELYNIEWGTKVLASQVVLLAKQGMSEEEIAKKLKKGKTEIELLLKFRQNEQE